MYKRKAFFRIGIAITALLSTFSVVFAINHNLEATSSYSIGGEVYGQIGAPTIGDRIYLGTKNNFGDPMGWALLEDYGSSFLAGGTSFMDTSTGMKQVEDVSVYYQFSEAMIRNSDAWKKFDKFNANLVKNVQDMKLVHPRDVRWQNSLGNEPQTLDFRKDSVFGIEALQSQMKYIPNMFTSSLIVDKATNVSTLESYFSTTSYAVSGGWGTTLKGEKKAYPYTGLESEGTADVICGGAGSTIAKTRCPWTTSTKPEFITTPQVNGASDFAMIIDNVPQSHMLVQMTGSWSDSSNVRAGCGFYEVASKSPNEIAYLSFPFLDKNKQPVIGAELPLRAYIELDKNELSQVVFSLSQSSSADSGYIKIKEPEQSPIGFYTTGEDRKLRIKEASMRATFTDITDEKNDSLYEKQHITSTDVLKVADTATIKLKINGNAGTHRSNGINFGTNTISALIFDDTGTFIAYAPLGTTQSGEAYYEMSMETYKDLLEIGKTYTIQVVNEVYSPDPTQVSPANCSELSDAYKFELFESLEMKYTPKFDETKATTASNEAYQYKANVSAGSKIGDVSLLKGATPATLEIVQDETHQADGHEDDWMNFTFYKEGVSNISSSKIDVTTNREAESFLEVRIKDREESPPDLMDDGYLKPGVYYFTLTGVDKAGLPDPKISINVQLAVFPHSSQITYTQQKDEVKNAYYTKKQLNSLAIDSSLGKINLDGPDKSVNSNIAGLYNEGYILKGIKLVDIDSDTENAYLKTDITSVEMKDPFEIDILKKTNVDFTTYEDTLMKFDIVLLFARNNKDIAEVRLEDQEFLLMDDLLYYNVNGEALEYTKQSPIAVTYDPVTDTNNKVQYYASTSTTANAMVKYCILNESGSCEDSNASTVVALDPDQALTNAGSASAGKVYVTANAPGTESKTVTIRAMLVEQKDGNETILTYTDLFYQVNPARQKLSWIGENIQEEGNNITKVSGEGNENQWEVSLKYDSTADSELNNIAVHTFVDGGSAVDHALNLQSDLMEGTVVSGIKYSISSINQEDKDKFILNADGSFTIKKDDFKDVVVLKAESEAVGNYAATEDKQKETAYLTITISKKPSIITYQDDATKVDSTAITLNSEEALGTKKIINTGIDITALTGYGFDIEKIEYKATSEGAYVETSSSDFLIKNGVSSSSKAELWVKTGLNNATVLSTGFYKITIKADKGGKEAANNKEFEIEVKKDAFAVEKLKWQSKETDKTAVDVGGSIASDTKINSMMLTHAYLPSGDIGDTFKVLVSNAEGSTLLDANTTIVYTLSEDSDTGFISVENDGTITTNAVCKEDTVLNIQAMIKKDGYEDMIVYLPVKITPAIQTLEWAGTNIYKSGNHVVKKDGATNEWMLSLQYDSTENADNSYSIEELLKDETMSDGSLSVKTNLMPDTVPSLEYSLDAFSKPTSDMNKIAFDDSTKKLTLLGELSGTADLKVCGNATGDYAATTADGCAILTISVSSKPKVVFTPEYIDGKIKALEEMAMGTASLGNVTLDPADIKKEYSYAVREAYQKHSAENGEVTWLKLPSTTFKTVVENGVTHLYYNTAHDSSGLEEGTYKIIIKAEKGNGDEATDKEVILIVTSAKLDVSKLKWTTKEEGASAEDVGGRIGTDNVNTKTLTHVFHENTFQVAIDNVTAGTLIDAETTIKYSLVDPKNEQVLSVAQSGAVTMHKASPEGSKVQIKAVITKAGYDDTTLYLPITITKAVPVFQFVNKSDDTTKYPLVDEGDPVHYESYKSIYEKDKGIDLFTVGAQGDVIVEILSRGASKGNDVLKFKTTDSTTNADTDNPKTCIIPKEEYAAGRLNTCEPVIEHAMNLVSDKGKIIIKATSAATDAYEAMSIEIPINIDKANQTDFKFKDAEITLESNTNGSFTPVFTGTQSSGYIILSTEKDAETEPDFTSEEMSVGEPNEALADAYLNGISDFLYNIVVPADKEERVGYVYAQKKGDRDYKDSDIKRQKVTILPEGSSMLTIKVESYPTADSKATSKVTYGDDHFKLSVMDDPEDPENPPVYTFEVEEEYQAFADPINNSSDCFSPKKAGDIYIKITQTDTKTGTEKTYRKKITIHKRKVKMEIEDIEKKVGMTVASDEYKLKEGSEEFLQQDGIIMQNVSFINNRRDGTPILSLTDGVELEDHQLPITMQWNESTEAKDKLSNYSITDLNGAVIAGNTPKPGKLIVTQDPADESWFTVAPGLKNDGTATTIGMDDWYNGPVDVKLLPASGSYDEISTDKEAWDSEKFTYANEGKNTVPVYFKQSSGDEKGAISDKAETTIKIDMTKPEVTSITGTEVKREGLEKLLHDLSFGIFFKQGVEVEIKAEDITPGGAGNAGKIEISGVESVTYQIYEVDEDGHLSQTPFISEADKTLDQGVLKFNINSSGKYYISVTAKDKAGNISDEAGSYLHVKKIDVDGDGDKIPDFNDSDDNGCPDLNIVLGEDSEGNKVKLNVAEKGKKYPYMNIDSNGDGKPDLNIDTDHDGRPDLNLVILTEKDWVPKTCVVVDKLKDYYSDPIEYCTGTDAKAVINVDTTGNGVPNINIDTNGDFIADINIDTDDDGKPDLNIVEITNWVPDKDCKVDNFLYDTMGNLIPLLNVDSDKDGYPDLNIDLDGDGIPDLNIDINHDGIPDIDIDGNGDGIPDVNVDTDHDGKPNENKVVITEWKPEKNVDGKIHYDTMDITGSSSIGDGGIIIEKPDGGKFLPNTAIKVQDVSDTIDTTTKESIDKVAGDQVVKKVYDVNYIVDGKPGQPDEKVNVKIPVDETIKHPKIIIEKEDGTFDIIDAKIEDGYYVFQTKYVGKVSIIGDPEDVVVDPDPEPTVNPDPDGENIDKATSVKGNYTPSSNVQKNGIGGAYTGDETSISEISMVCIFALLGLVFLWKKQAQR